MFTTHPWQQPIYFTQSQIQQCVRMFTIMVSAIALKIILPKQNQLKYHLSNSLIVN